jgi:hypothetical protein
MKIKLLGIFMLFFSLACGSTGTEPTLPSENLEIPQKKRDRYEALQMQRTTGTRYNPKYSEVEKIAIEDLPDGVLAIVNKDVITKQDVIKNMLDQGIDLNVPPPQRDEMIEQGLSTLIYTKLVTHAIETNQLIADEGKVKEALDELHASLKVKKMSFEKYLKKRKTTEQAIRESIVVYIFLNSLITDVMKKIEYQIIKRDVEQTREFILLMQGGAHVKKEDLPSLRKGIERLRTRALNGEDFKKLTLKWSSNIFSGKNDGIMSVKQGDDNVPAPIYKAVFELHNEGEIGPIKKLPEDYGYGYFLVQLKKIIVPTAEDKKEAILERVSGRLEALFYDKLIDSDINMVTRLPKPEVPDYFQAEPDKDK